MNISLGPRSLCFPPRPVPKSVPGHWVQGPRGWYWVEVHRVHSDQRFDGWRDLTGQQLSDISSVPRR
jgi:hypothetical protein